MTLKVTVSWEATAPGSRAARSAPPPTHSDSQAGLGPAGSSEGRRSQGVLGTSAGEGARDSRAGASETSEARPRTPGRKEASPCSWGKRDAGLRGARGDGAVWPWTVPWAARGDRVKDVSREEGRSPEEDGSDVDAVIELKRVDE